jgi:hypothetical protein
MIVDLQDLLDKVLGLLQQMVYHLKFMDCNDYLGKGLSGGN